MDDADPDLPDADVEHISQMLTLAKRKHQEAMVMLSTPDPNAVPRLREAVRLIEEVELLANDASTYIETGLMKAALKDLHFQQANVQMAIAQLGQLSVTTCSRPCCAI